MRYSLLVLGMAIAMSGCALGQGKPKSDGVVTFHNCHMEGGSGNHPHLFDTSEIYQCDEGKVEIAGRRTMAIEYGYVYEQELGRPSCERPHVAAEYDYESYEWCPNPTQWDPHEKRMCGDKPGKCFDGKPATWDPDWRGYSCVTPDHK